MNATQKPMISAIVAMTEDNVIGHQNQLLWHLPADLKHFKTITMGHPIIMGRKTYESIGKALPGRTNIVVTRDKTWQAPDCIVCHTLDEAIEVGSTKDQNEIFIIGGQQIYQHSLPYLQRLYLTLVHHPFSGEAYFPKLNAENWREIKREDHEKDAKNPYPYSFLVLERMK